MIPTLQEIKNQFSHALESVYAPSEAAQLTWTLLEESLGLSRAQLLVNLSVQPDSGQWQVLQKRCIELQKGVPIQYIFGETTFFGLPFKVNQHTLIPRPETEEIVHHILLEARKLTRLNILDIGTGSGCIAISLAKHLPTANVFGLDISGDALQIARENARLNETDVHFDVADILQWESSLPREILGICNSAGWDLIVSNPPYIPQAEQSSMHINVLEHEPHTALFVPDEDPLLFYREIGRFAGRYLKPNGQLWFEIHETLAQEYLKLRATLSLGQAEIIPDLNNKQRMLVIRKGH